jgi:hypothetical protein
MKRNEVIEILEKYNKFLMDEGYCDFDLIQEPTAIDQFMIKNGITKL